MPHPRMTRAHTEKAGVMWRDDGTAVDRHNRTAEQIRASAHDLEALAAEVVDLAARCAKAGDLEPEIRRGANFAHRFEATRQALDRFAAREVARAEEVERAAAREAERRAR